MIDLREWKCLMNIINLNKQVAIVTGATGAIGSSIVEHLTQHGASVFLTSSPGSAEQMQNMGDSNPGIIGSLAIDLSAPGACDEVLKLAISHSPTAKVDILVNCAGIAIDNLFLRISDEEWDNQFNVNLKSLWKLTQATLKHMSRNRYGRVISISSVIGHIGNVGQVVYASTKSALYGMTKSLAREVAQRGITVNTVSPGFIESPMTAKLVANDELFQKVLSNIPMGQIGKPEDVAAAVVYLASYGAKYVTGIDISVCGGMYMN
jgi:3-oxoacyl-[acyl-carrier protein] reductase